MISNFPLFLFSNRDCELTHSRSFYMWKSSIDESDTATVMVYDES